MCRMTGYSSEIPLAPRIGARGAADLEGLAHVVELAEADLLGAQLPRVLEAARGGGRAACPWCSSSAMSASLAWVSWKPPIGLPNCSRVAGVVQRRLVRRPRRAHRAPDDPVAGLVQAASGPLQPADLRQHGVGGQPYVVQDELAGDRGAQRHLVLDLGRGEARGCRWGRRSRGCPSVGLRPHDGDVGDRAVGDPHLAAVEDPVGAVAGAVATGAGAHRPGSEPASGSVSPKQPIVSPAAMPGSHSCFCSSEP